jgi:hypothetical protein
MAGGQLLVQQGNGRWHLLPARLVAGRACGEWRATAFGPGYFVIVKNFASSA